MFSDDEEKQYVTPEQGHKEFPTGVGVWTYCAQCGVPLIVPKGCAPFCGRNASAYREIAARLN